MPYLDNQHMFVEIDQRLIDLNHMLDTDTLFNPARPLMTSMDKICEILEQTRHHYTPLTVNTSSSVQPSSVTNDLLTELDRTKLQTYVRMPEMILKTGEWESFAVCSACKGNIGIKEWCLKTYKRERQPQQHKCPCCNLRSVAVLCTTPNGQPVRNNHREELYDIYPIPHERFRRRYHTLQFERKKPWWKFWGTNAPGEGFWEYDHIPHSKPLVTEPPPPPPPPPKNIAAEKLLDALSTIEDLQAEIKVLKANATPNPIPPTPPKRTRSKKAK